MPGPSSHRPGAHPPHPWLPWLHVAMFGIFRPLRAPAQWVCSSLGSVLGDPTPYPEKVPEVLNSHRPVFPSSCPSDTLESGAGAFSAAQSCDSSGVASSFLWGSGRRPAGLCCLALVLGPLLQARKVQQVGRVRFGAHSHRCPIPGS